MEAMQNIMRHEQLLVTAARNYPMRTLSVLTKSIARMSQASARKLLRESSARYDQVALAEDKLKAARPYTTPLARVGSPTLPIRCSTRSRNYCTGSARQPQRLGVGSRGRVASCLTQYEVVPWVC